MLLPRRLLTAALLATALPLAVHAAPAAVAAAVATTDRPAEARAMDAGRHPVEVLGFLGLRKGDHALDVWADSGYYTELMAKAVGPKGSVTAFQPANFADDTTTATYAGMQKRAPNVKLAVASFDDASFAPKSLDFTLMHMTYHDLYWESEKYKFPRTDPAKFLAKLYAATKPGGIVGVVDHVAEPGDTRATVEKLHRIDPATVKADFKAAGFVFDGESPLLHMASDDHSKLVFDPAVRGKTDRFIFRFRKPR